jgi:hypothetical protein
MTTFFESYEVHTWTPDDPDSDFQLVQPHDHITIHQNGTLTHVTYAAGANPANGSASFGNVKGDWQRHKITYKQPGKPDHAYVFTAFVDAKKNGASHGPARITMVVVGKDLSGRIIPWPLEQHPQSLHSGQWR